MLKNRLKSIRTHVLEIIVILVLLTLAFGAVVEIVNSFFPEGSGLMAKREGGVRGLFGGNSGRVMVSSGGMDLSILEQPGVAAVIKDTVNNVKRKSSKDIAWGKAVSGVALLDHDAIQTFGKSKADIVFDAGNEITLGENSLLIVQRMEKDLYLKEKRSVLVMVDGEISGTISSDKNKALSMEVSTLGAVTRIKGTNEGGEPTQFNIRINPDKSSTITVFSGFAEMMAAGKTIIIESNQSVTVEEGKAPQKVVPVPRPVQLAVPNDRQTYAYRDLPPGVDFNWQPIDGATQYHIAIARDSEFDDVIYDGKTPDEHFMHGGLRVGKYYWRVSAISNKTEGWVSETRQLLVAQDNQPPSLVVTIPAPVSEKQTVVVKGRSDQDAHVYIDSNQVALDDNGMFSYELRIKPGNNIVVVEAIDQVGNMAYEKQMVYGKY